MDELIEFILTYLPDAEHYSYLEAIQEATARDQRAADNLLFSLEN